MKEVYPGLYVGSQDDIDEFAEIMNERINKMIAVTQQPQFYIVHAAKEPWHRKAVGYTTRGAPKNHPEYLWARRTQRLALNLVDVPESKAQYIPDELLREAVDYIHWAHQEKNKPVFIHCNEGKSRAPSIALLYLLKHTQLFEPCDTFEEVESFYKTLCPSYEPNGIREKVKEFWNLCQQPLGETESKDD